MIRSSLQRQPTYHSILTTRRHQSSSPLNPISADPIPTSYDSIKPPKGIHLSTSSSPSPALSSRVKFDHHRKILQARLDPHLLTAQTHINHYLKSSRKNLNDRLKALEWEKRLGEVGGRINDATGYGEIERLRKGVVERGKTPSLFSELFLPMGLDWTILTGR
jgi:sensitive to high expression protein 9